MDVDLGKLDFSSDAELLRSRNAGGNYSRGGGAYRGTLIDCVKEFRELSPTEQGTSSIILGDGTLLAAGEIMGLAKRSGV